MQDGSKNNCRILDCEQTAPTPTPVPPWLLHFRAVPSQPFQPQLDISSQSLGEGEAMSGMHVGLLIAKTPSNKRGDCIGSRVQNWIIFSHTGSHTYIAPLYLNPNVSVHVVVISEGGKKTWANCFCSLQGGRCCGDGPLPQASVECKSYSFRYGGEMI